MCTRSQCIYTHCTHTHTLRMEPATSLSFAQRTRRTYCRKTPGALWPGFLHYRSGNGAPDWVTLPTNMGSATWTSPSSVADGQGTYTDSKYTKIPSAHQTPLSRGLALPSCTDCKDLLFWPVPPRPPSPGTGFAPTLGRTHPHTPTSALTRAPLPRGRGGLMGSHSTSGTLAQGTDTACLHSRLPGGPPAPLGQRLGSSAPPDSRPCTSTWRHLYGLMG